MKIIGFEKRNIEKFMKIVEFEGKRILHISHKDLDGIFAFILTRHVAKYNKPESVEYLSIDPNELYDEVLKVIDSLDEYDLIIITDLRIEKRVFDLIEKYNDKFIIFDHHLSDDVINDDRYWDAPWIEIESHEYVNYTDEYLEKTEIERKTCGTKLYWEYIKKLNIFDRVITNIDDLVDIVRIYDTYEFKQEMTPYKNERYRLLRVLAPKLNTLFHSIDNKTFSEYILSFINRNKSISRLLSADDENPGIKYILDNELRRVDAHIEKKLKTLHVDYFHNTKSGIIFSEENISEIGNRALDLYPEIEMCVIINGNYISLRSRTTDNVNVADIATKYGGGGHKNAAGFVIDRDVIVEAYMAAATITVGYLEMYKSKRGE